MNKNKNRILLAEDERALSQAMNLKLTKAGFDVTCVDDGEAALTTARTEDFDLVLMDIMMPKLDGLSALRQLKQEGYKKPVVIISNLGQAEDIDKAKKLGAIEYLIKTDTGLDDLVEKVKDRIG